VIVAASRDAKAIARYSAGAFVAFLPLTTKKASLSGGLLEVRFRDPR